MILNNINENYTSATGYGGWENYEIFADISYNLVVDDDLSLVNRKISSYILKGCCEYRIYACELMNKARGGVKDSKLKGLLSK